jgi:DNA-binding NarL/FixJ family response regulator
MSDAVRFRVLVAEGHALKRAGMMFAVHQHPALDLAGEVADVPAACRFVAEEKPDLVICNLELPGDGLALLHAARPLHPPARWIVVCPLTDALTLQRTVRAGACGCVLEEEGLGELLPALHEAVAGRPFMSRKISSLLLASAVRKVPARWESLLHSLSDREWQVFRRLGRRQGVAAMARELGIAKKTIETHERRIQEKLHLPGAQRLHAAAEEWAASSSGPAEVEGRMLFPDSEPAAEEWTTPWEADQRPVIFSNCSG